MNIRIPGIDPVTMQRVQERTTKQVVQETQEVKITDKQHQGRGRRQPRDREELERYLGRLNRAVAAVEKPLRFQLVERQGQLVVQIIDTFQNRLLREVGSDKVFDLVLKLEEMIGILVDGLI